MFEDVETPVLRRGWFAGVGGFVVFKDDIGAGDGIGFSGKEACCVEIWFFFFFLLVFVLADYGGIICAFV